jgi:hypothetical protein
MKTIASMTGIKYKVKSCTQTKSYIIKIKKSKHLKIGLHAIINVGLPNRV